MKYLPEAGIVLDALQYGAYCFSSLVEQAKSNHVDLRGRAPLLYFDQFLNGNPLLRPDERFYPFFFFNSEHRTIKRPPIVDYYWKYFDFEADDIRGFLDSISTEQFKTHCLSHYISETGCGIELSKIAAADPVSIIRLISMLNSHGEQLVHFVDFFLRFDDIVREFAVYFENSVKAMTKFHGAHIPCLLESACTDIEAKTGLLKSVLGIAHSTNNGMTSFTVQFMDHYTVLYKLNDADSGIIFIVGASYEKTIARWDKYGSITIKSIAQLLGNQVILDIIKMLSRNAKTVSQLSRELYVSRSTIDRYVQELRDELVINTAKKIGSEVYYEINPQYFIMAQNLMFNFFEAQIVTKKPLPETRADAVRG